VDADRDGVPDGEAESAALEDPFVPEGEGDVEPPKVENQPVTTVEPECMKYSRPEERETWCESQFDNV